MFIARWNNLPQITSGDKASLREFLHPNKAPLRLRYSLAHATVEPGASTLPHRLLSAEVYYILEGQGIMHLDGEAAPVQADDAVYIPPQAEQHITNTGNTELKFLCIVDPPWQPADETISRNPSRP